MGAFEDARRPRPTDPIADGRLALRQLDKGCPERGERKNAPRGTAATTSGQTGPALPQVHSRRRQQQGAGSKFVLLLTGLMATDNDKAVLEAVFNPLFSEFGFSTDAEDAAETESAAQDDGTPNQVKTLEVEGVEAAEKGDIDRAIDIFGNVIRLAPNRASGYNNRAQALRIKGDVDRALEDLNNAINLGQTNRHAAAQALCQRGLIHRLRGQDQEALADFKEAAKLGSQFAKNQLVQMNPYAALCNRMLGEMFAKLRQGEDDDR